MAKETKQHILRGFSELLNDHDFDKITVTMLVEKCNISRQTFYYHFTDIQALIDWGVKQYTHGRVESAKNANNIKDATVIYFNGIMKNKLFLRKCFASSLSGYMTKLIRDSVKEYCSEFYSRAVKSGYAKTEEADFIMEFTAYGVTGFIIAKIFENEDVDIEDLSDKLFRCIFARLAGSTFLNTEIQ